MKSGAVFAVLILFAGALILALSTDFSNSPSADRFSDAYIEEKAKSLTPTKSPLPDESAGLANPASMYCEEQGGKIEMRTNEDGTYGVCVFDDKSECEEWAFLRGECGKGQSLKTALNVDKKADAELIKQALIKSNLFDPTVMELVLTNDDGKYATGITKPKMRGLEVGETPFYAVRTEQEWKIIFSGTGLIYCSTLVPYPDFPSSMISQCMGDDGAIVKR